MIRGKLDKALISISYAQLEMKRIKYNMPQVSRERGADSESLKRRSDKHASFLCTRRGGSLTAGRFLPGRRGSRILPMGF